ncbi:MAG: hypothetical protein WBD99_05185 [Thermodesulfobacteriota bacterium]
MLRWAIYLDIEGFEYLYLAANKYLAYQLLTGLVRDVCFIIEKIYPEPDLLFRDATFSFIAHQFGDGVTITPGIIGKDTLKIFKPICVSIALMRTTAMRGGFAKASISHGDMADFKGVYPDEIQDKFDESGSVIDTRYGSITIVPVMGEGLIRAYKLSREVQGPLLIIDPIFEDEVAKLDFNIITKNKNYIEIDWIYPKVDLVNDIIEKIGLEVPTDKEIVKRIQSYLETYNALPLKWRENALRLINISS